MNRSKLYIVIIIALLISNAILIGFMIFPKEKNRRGDRTHNVKEKIVQKLEFDENQVAAFEKLIEKHREDINKTDEEIMRSKRLLFKQLQEDNQHAPDSILQQIASFQQQAEHIKFNHLKEIKNLCTPEQQDNFKALMDELGDIIQKNRRRKK